MDPFCQIINENRAFSSKECVSVRRRERATLDWLEKEREQVRQALNKAHAERTIVTCIGSVGNHDSGSSRRRSSVTGATTSTMTVAVPTEHVNTLTPPKKDTPTHWSATTAALVSPQRKSARNQVSIPSKGKMGDFHSSDSALFFDMHLPDVATTSKEGKRSRRDRDSLDTSRSNHKKNGKTKNDSSSELHFSNSSLILEDDEEVEEQAVKSRTNLFLDRLISENYDTEEPSLHSSNHESISSSSSSRGSRHRNLSMATEQFIESLTGSNMESDLYNNTSHSQTKPPLCRKSKQQQQKKDPNPSDLAPSTPNAAAPHAGNGAGSGGVSKAAERRRSRHGKISSLAEYLVAAPDLSSSSSSSDKKKAPASTSVDRRKSMPLQDTTSPRRRTTQQQQPQHSWHESCHRRTLHSSTATVMQHSSLGVPIVKKGLP